MGTISLASLKSVDTCQQQFLDRRWNCSSIVRVPKLSRDLKRGTREQAFVYAITSASLVHSLARACSIGITTKCSCGALPNEPPAGDYKWGGCGDDVSSGLHFSESFADEITKKISKKFMMNSHNNKAGRKIVADNLTTACKCHGVSGSCSIKTCWRALPDFESIGSILKNRYALAVEVKRRTRQGQKVYAPINKNRKTIHDDELVYYTKSPDYCSPDPKSGSVGTQGRACIPDSPEPRGCNLMCCGRGHISEIMEIVERCECKYYWCCYVKCKSCTRTMDVHRCR
ncbi:hypothetical protein ACJMK2_019066 [Sinanodonta woodiana]|uniref:Protein Wnt n=1 Tax=Sinanodonta woodiana TaxID=1069815 RepID=A0ABD3UFC9_SINWO